MEDSAAERLSLEHQVFILQRRVEILEQEMTKRNKKLLRKQFIREGMEKFFNGASFRLDWEVRRERERLQEEFDQQTECPKTVEEMNIDEMREMVTTLWYAPGMPGAVEQITKAEINK